MEGVTQTWVGVTATCERLAHFTGPNSYQHAADFIDRLPNPESGQYYLDVDCGEGED